MIKKSTYKKFELQWIGFILIFFFFILFSLYFALNTKLGISPDEIYHFNLSLFFSETLSIPENTIETFRYGQISRIPFLFYWINARFINANILEIPILTLLRCLSIFYALGTLFFTFLLSKEFIKNKWLQLLPVFLLSNTLMFVFISSSVNYDNLLNLFAIGSIYFLVRFFKHQEVRWFFWWGIFAISGLITKNTMQPLFVIEVGLFAYYLIKYKFLRLKEVISFKELFFIKILFSVLFLLVSIYFGYNIIKYQSLIPACDKVLTTEQCMFNGIYARNAKFDNIDIFSFDGLSLIIKERLSPYEYFTRWLLSMNDRMYGIMGGENLIMPSWIASIYVLFEILILAIIIRKYNKSEGGVTKLLLISILYSFVLFLFNFKTYLETGIYVLALQGRYIFPVLPVLYIIYIVFIEKIETKFLRYLILAIMILLFVVGCIPLFILRYPSSWFV